jgi:hypothetical protein
MRADHKLRDLVYVHSIVDVHRILTLAYLASRAADAPLAMHLLHLVELVVAARWATLVSVAGAHVELVAEEAFGVGRVSGGTGGGGGSRGATEAAMGVRP